MCIVSLGHRPRQLRHRRSPVAWQAVVATII